MNRVLCYIGCLGLALLAGCNVLPQVGREPMYHNPFPQLTKIAVAPFFNLSSEAAVDGRQFAEAYGNELQNIPGFEVIPVGVVERAMDAHHISLGSPQQVRWLAQQLGVDAVVVGAVTEFTPYYPPRCGLQIEWYAANPYFHPIPPGYGLPWGTSEEKDIPATLVTATEMSLAREQLKTQTPPYEPEPLTIEGEEPPLPATEPEAELLQPDEPATTGKQAEAEAIVYHDGKENPASPDGASGAAAAEPGATGATATNGEPEGIVPRGWPDARGLFPPPPGTPPTPTLACNEPVLRSTRIYDGADGEFTTTLSNYYFFRSDERGARWQGYLTRMPDFIRFCCYHNITEMIAARGGVDEARVVWRWGGIR